MASVKIYTTKYCIFCMRAKHLLSSKDVSFEEIKMDGDTAGRQKLAKRSGSRTVPQIWIGEKHVGGCDELYALDRAGRLDSLLG